MSEDPTPTDPGVPDRVPPPADGEPAPDPNGAVAGLWARVVELEREARWLSAKCDELRHSCRDLLAAVGPPGPLTEDQVRSIQSDTPQRSSDEVFTEYRRLREERAAGLPPPPSGVTAGQLTCRIADLERTATALAARRAELRPIFLALADAFDPFAPPAEEELHDMLHGPRGRPLIEIIEERERELGA